MLDSKGATKISLPSLIEEIMVANNHHIYPEVLATIKSYKKPRIFFSESASVALKETIRSIASPIERDIPLFDLYSILNLSHRIKYLRIPTRAMAIIP